MHRTSVEFSPWAVPRSVPGRTARLARVSIVFLVAVATACDQSPRVATTDSLLNRDLTLAAASGTPALTPGLSDTAIAEPTNVPVSRLPSPTASAAPASPPVAASAKAVVPPPRVVPQRTSQTAPVARSQPVEPEVTPAPVTRGNDSVSGAGATGGGTPAGSGTTRRALGSGTRLTSRTNAEICSLANRPGDRLVATLSADVASADGGKLAAGTPVLIEMSAPATDGTFAFRVKSVQVNGVLVPVEGTVAVAGETTERQVSKGGDKGKVVGGAIAGAIIGRVLGGGTKGAIIGAAGGAAAGTAAAARNTVAEQCLPAGATVTITLTAPLVLSEGVP